MKRAFALLSLCQAVVLAGLNPGDSLAQGRPRYDGITAGLEAQERHEQRRLDAVGRQLGTIDEMKWYSNLDQWSIAGDRFDYAPSLDYIYGVVPPRRHGPAYEPYDVFEPWPAVPGDIWGHPLSQSVAQPVGHRSEQTGPDRWEYHPVYQEEIEPDLAEPELIPLAEPERRKARIPARPAGEETALEYFESGPREF